MIRPSAGSGLQPGKLHASKSASPHRWGRRHAPPHMGGRPKKISAAGSGSDKVPHCLVYSAHRRRLQCNLGAEVTFRGSRLGTSLKPTPVASGRRPIHDRAKNIEVPAPRMPSNSHPHPSQSIQAHTHFRLPAAPFLPAPRARGLMAAAAAMPPPALPPSSSSLLHLWHVIARHGQLDALHAAALRRGRIGSRWRLTPHRDVAK